MVTALIVVHVLLCVGLCITVLLQAGKGGGLSGAFGGAGAQTVLGKRGAASFLAKLTRWMAIGFMLLSLGLAFIYSSASPAAQVTDAETTEEDVAEEGVAEEGAPIEEGAEPAVDGARPAVEGAQPPGETEGD